MKTNTLKMMCLLALLAAFPPLSTDMYLPALPLLQQIWQQPMSVVNLTLSGFFIGFCISMLLYGPLSDKYGRKPLLMVGIMIYIAASFVSGFVDDIYHLICLRVLQGVGASSGVVISMAITKDLYEGKQRQRILAYMAVIMALAPMLAPILGGVIMAWLSWNWVFFMQAVMGMIALGGVFWLKEPLQEPENVSISETMRLYLKLFGNWRYIGLVLLFSVIVLPHFSFIGSASNIYISHFGMSEQVFSYFFAFNAAAIMAGSFICTRIQRRMASEKIVTIGFAGILAAGLFMHADLVAGPWGLALPMALSSFFFGLSRPPSNYLVLLQVDRGAGTASSLMIFLYFIVAAFAMWFISLDWTGTIHVIARMAIFSALFVLAIWLPMVKKLDLNAGE
ncbi:multidrug effflux MFS transporter [Desulfobacter postgatei]|jgi:DHA1 family bicyclomycin/chloramphenicol resistance-like MFS transporter|uniref:multidrug effflux MFS transporter n=1 Tax=Desulfobacter postgatei TaxID=2293 RepID=UPI002A3706B9|nr:multidrug effflux MFS transporter [Desulfobacter postgatei]MDX9962850.1 multidrug effflux MFS transporter [Desulfobacter postgatei]